ncbi:MAG: transporter [Solirubrobacterales bacterium]|nr:transporter [Solirubrobacterales bacterium]
MIFASNVLDRAGETLGAALPRILGAFILLVVGILLAQLVGRLVGRALHAAGVDRAAENVGVPGILQRAGLPAEISKVTAIAIRLALTLTVIFAALSLLGLQFLSQSLNQAVLFVPKLLLALALVLVGLVLGSIVRDRVDRASVQMDLPVPLGAVAQIVVVTIFLITAAAQVTISIALLMVLLAIVLAGAVATIALAFGLGGQQVARALSAGRYVRNAHPVGQRIRFGEFTGTVQHVDGTAAVLLTQSGETIRVPNNVLIESIVIIEAEPADIE